MFCRAVTTSPDKGAVEEHQAFPGAQVGFGCRGCESAVLFSLEPPPAQATRDAFNTQLYFPYKGERCFLLPTGLQISPCGPLVSKWQISAVIAKTVLSGLLIA